MTARSILWLEDNVQQVEALRTYLTSVKDFVLVGSTGSAYEALELVKELHPDIILVDLDLDYGHGYIFLDDLKSFRLRPRPFVAVVSHSRNVETQTTVAQKGAFFIGKNNSFGPRYLLSLLRSWLDRRSVELRKEVVSLPPEQTEVELRTIIANELALQGIDASGEGSRFTAAAVAKVMLRLRHGQKVPEFNAVCREIACEFNEANSDIPALCKKNGKGVATEITRTIERIWSDPAISNASLEAFYPYMVSDKTGRPTCKKFVCNLAIKFISDLAEN